MDVVIERNSRPKSAFPRLLLAIMLVAVMAYAVSYLFAVSPIIVQVLATLVSGS